MGRRRTRPMQPAPQRRCLGKKPYPDQQTAEASIDKQARTWGFYAPDYRAYRCRHCGNYHIGHRPGLGRERGI